VKSKKKHKDKPGDDFRYICKKCSSERLTLYRDGNLIGLRCLQCGSWVTWTSRAMIEKDYKYIKQFPENDNIQMVVFTTKLGHKIAKCGNCRCTLYELGAPRPIYQFNLVDALYCPACGKQLI
jgi:DNA-directed RNA polymerase subunit RPC12/RpoP